MTDGRVRSPHPDEEPLEPPLTPGTEEEVEEAPLDDRSTGRGGDPAALLRRPRDTGRDQTAPVSLLCR